MVGKNKIMPSELSLNSLPSVVNKSKRRNTLESPNLSSAGNLNDVIVKMLQVNRQTTPCKQHCSGNPITTGGQRRQMAKMLIVVLIPLTILASITAIGFSKSLFRFVSTKKVMSQLRFGEELGNVLLALQKERDMSSLYVSKIGLVTKDDLLHAYPDTDAALKNLSVWPIIPDNKKRNFYTKEHYLNHINEHRYRVESRKRNVTSEIVFYSRETDMFIQLVYDAITEMETGLIWKALAGFQALLMANEYLGRERGYGINFFMIGSFKNKNAYLQFLESQDSARTHFESARQYSEISYSVYQSYIENKKDKMDQIEEMRNEVKSNKALSDGSIERAKWWFTNMSIFTNVMQNTQKNITAKIRSLLEDKLRHELMDMIGTGAIFICIIMISPLLSLFVYMMTSFIQKYSQSIAQKTKSLSREKRQSQTILYQMLPKTIAKDLLENGTVNAEQFQECTILQSDMVGFTKISASSSPLQVTQMLNILFSCFDSRIAVYDAYKVETVGDGYMVASGVPKRNGKRHASEIATLALDIMHHVNKLELPHRPGEKFSMRMGCHTGPVVAGVVGHKNPRYSIFGSTVRIVGLMESSGKANKIQISDTMFRLLETIGGFEMELRSTEVGSIIWKELQGFEISNKTHWLLKKTDQDFEDDLYSECSGFLSFGSSLLYQ